MTIKQILYLDDNADAWILEALEHACGVNNVQLTPCVVGPSTERGIHAIAMLKCYLDNCVRNNSIHLIQGVILDIQIPIKTLEIFGSELSRVPTGNGADTGFAIARHIFANQSGLSPYDNRFENIPILFLSISGFDMPLSKYNKYANPYIDWMGDKYTECCVSPNTKYTHLQKKELRRQPDLIDKWITYAASSRYDISNNLK